MPSAIVFFATHRSGSPGSRSSSSVLKATEPHEEASTAQGAWVLSNPASRRIPRPSDLVARRSRSIRHLFLCQTAATPRLCCFRCPCSVLCQRARLLFVNDPSAGSPTETLLRLLRPLESTVCPSSRHQRRKRVAAPSGPVQGAH